LGLDCLDIVFLHDIEFTNFEQSVAEALPALKKEQEKGKVRYVGVAGYPFKTVEYVVNHYNIDVTLNYNHYTLQNRRLVSDLLPLLQVNGVGVLNASPFAQRLLTHTELPFWHAATPEVREVCRQVVDYCQTRGVDPAKLCVQFSVRHPDLTTCVIGSGDPDNVRKWVRWLEEPYEEDAIAGVEQILQPVMNQNSIYGKPENNDPPHAPSRPHHNPCLT
jgi:aryl-alcohol dehydrogenase-like predicted oxidoreductase